MKKNPRPKRGKANKMMLPIIPQETIYTLMTHSLFGGGVFVNCSKKILGWNPSMDGTFVPIHVGHLPIDFYQNIKYNLFIRQQIE